MILALLLFIAAPVQAEPIDTATLEAVLEIADAQGVPRSVAKQLMIEESGNWRTGALGDPLAVGKEAGWFASRGLYQLHDRWIETFIRDYWHEPEPFDVYNALHNATVALAYLSDLHRRFGSWYLAACAYNWGPGNVASGREPPALTREYAARIAAD